MQYTLMPRKYHTKFEKHLFLNVFHLSQTHIRFALGAVSILDQRDILKDLQPALSNLYECLKLTV